MALQSTALRGDPKLEACLTSDAAHIVKGSSGAHVHKIQLALMALDHSPIDAGDLTGSLYGASTAAAVLAYKRRRSIINGAYQSQADDVVGKMTIAALDRELAAIPVPQVGKDLAKTDCPLANRLIQNALQALNQRIVPDLKTLQASASVDTSTFEWQALKTHFKLLPPWAAAAGSFRPVTDADIAIIRTNYLAVAQVLFNSDFAFENGPPALPGSPAAGSSATQKIAFSPFYKNFDTPDGKAIGPNSRAAILIHEGIHLTDTLSGSPQTHVSEFTPAYDVQSADNALHNSSAYASFAWHVTRGFDRPRFGLGAARSQ